MPRTLRRCSICKKFHASYLVLEEGKEMHYCHACWKVYCRPAKPAADENTQESQKQAEEKNPQRNELLI
jgi:ribosome-binding protein aMBF1 (putative translation factor)